jgi:hypothetical protein
MFTADGAGCAVAKVPDRVNNQMSLLNTVEPQLSRENAISKAQRVSKLFWIQVGIHFPSR